MIIEVLFFAMVIITIILMALGDKFQSELKKLTINQFNYLLVFIYFATRIFSIFVIYIVQLVLLGNSHCIHLKIYDICCSFFYKKVRIERD